MKIKDTDYSKTIFSQGIVCINTNTDTYCVVIDGTKGSEKDRCSLVLEFIGEDGYMIHTTPNRALKPTGKIVNLKGLAKVLRHDVAIDE